MSDTGIRRKVESRLVPLPAEPGEERRYAHFSRDLTDFREAERHQELLASIVDCSTDAVFAVGRDEVVTAWNRGAQELYGYTAAQVLGKPIETYLAPQSASEVRRILNEVLAGKGPFHYEARRYKKNGTAIDLSVSTFGIYDGTGELVGAATVQRDVSKRMRNDAALLEAQAQLRSRLEQQRAVAEFGQQALRATVLAPLLDGAVALVSATLGVDYSKVLELQPHGEELLLRAGTGWKDGLIGKAMLSAGKDSQAGYTLMCDAPVIVDNVSTESRFNVSSLLLDHGVVSGVSVIIRGRERPYGVLGAHTISQRKFTPDDANFVQAIANLIAQAVERMAGEQAQRRSEEYYRSLIDNSSDSIVIIGADGMTRYANSSAYSMFGYQWRDPRGHKGHGLVYPDDLEIVRRGLAATLETGAAAYECRVLRNDGTWAHIEVHGSRVPGLDGEPVANVQHPRRQRTQGGGAGHSRNPGATALAPGAAASGRGVRPTRFARRRT